MDVHYYLTGICPGGEDVPTAVTVMYEGRPTLRIRLRDRDGASWTVHVDRKTCQHLSSKSDRVLDLKRRHRFPTAT